MLQLQLPLETSADLSVYHDGAKFFLYPLKTEISVDSPHHVCIWFLRHSEVIAVEVNQGSGCTMTLACIFPFP